MFPSNRLGVEVLPTVQFTMVTRAPMGLPQPALPLNMGKFLEPDGIHGHQYYLSYIIC